VTLIKTKGKKKKKTGVIWMAIIVWCGAFGGKEINGVLKTLRGQ